MLKKANGDFFVGEDKQAEARDVMRMFPTAFTMLSVFLFLIPAALALRNDIDPVVTYWRGDSASHLFLAIIPLIIVAAHIYHVRFGANKYVSSLAAIVPGLMLVVFGFRMGTTNPERGLFSIDCNIMPEKANLQLEWEAAKLLYKTCLQETANKPNSTMTLDYLSQHFTIQDCTEYERDLAFHQKTWPYLQYLEENIGCTGFCIPGPPLWTPPSKPHKDSCAVAVASAFKYMAAPHAKQMLMISVLTVGFVVVSLAILVPLLDKLSS